MPRTINDIFSGPAPAPTPVPSGSNPLSTLALVALVVVFGVLAFNRFSPGPGPNPGPDGDKQEQVNPVALDGYVYCVYERQDPSVADANAYDMVSAYCTKHEGLEVRGVDQNDASKQVVELIEYAKSKGVSPPCVIFRTKQLANVNAIALPRTEKELERVFRK